MKMNASCVQTIIMVFRVLVTYNIKILWSKSVLHPSKGGCFLPTSAYECSGGLQAVYKLYFREDCEVLDEAKISYVYMYFASFCPCCLCHRLKLWMSLPSNVITIKTINAFSVYPEMEVIEITLAKVLRLCQLSSHSVSFFLGYRFFNP
jgi:hypothetical protein